MPVRGLFVRYSRIDSMLVGDGRTGEIVEQAPRCRVAADVVNFNVRHISPSRVHEPTSERAAPLRYDLLPVDRICERRSSASNVVPRQSSERTLTATHVVARARPRIDRRYVHGLRDAQPSRGALLRRGPLNDAGYVRLAERFYAGLAGAPRWYPTRAAGPRPHRAPAGDVDRTAPRRVKALSGAKPR
jgi:hypothetical protein